MMPPFEELVLYACLEGIHDHGEHHHHKQKQLRGMALEACVHRFRNGCQGPSACDDHRPAAEAGCYHAQRELQQLHMHQLLLRAMCRVDTC